MRLSTERFCPSGWVSQFYVFHGEDCLGWDCFQKDGVVVGSGPDADLVLEGYGIAESQALVQCNGDQVLVHDLAGNGLVHVNGQPATACLLGPLDVLGVGPYALKVRSRAIRGDGKSQAGRERALPAGTATEVPEPSRSAEWEVPAPDPWDTPWPLDAAPAAGESASLDLPEVNFPADAAPRATAPAPELEPPDLPLEAALAELDTARMLAALDDLIDGVTRPDEGEEPAAGPVAPGGRRRSQARTTPPAPRLPTPVPFETVWAAPDPDPAPEIEEVVPQPLWPEPAEVAHPEPESPEPLILEPVPVRKVPWPHPAAANPAPSVAWLGSGSEEEEDEEEDEAERDREADFSLIDRLAPTASPAANGSDATLIQVIKVRGNQVLDCRYIGPGEAYRDGRGRRARPVVERDRKRGTFLYLIQGEAGAEVRTPEGAVLDAPGLCRPEHLVSKRRQVYRCPLPARSRSVVSVGPTRYVIHEVPACPELEVPVPATESRRPLRTFLGSSLVHAIALCMGALFLSLPSPYEPPEPETRFVQIDTTDLQPLMRKPVVAQPTETLQPAPVKPAEPKPVAPPTAKPVTVAKKAPPPKPNAAPAPPPSSAQVAKAPPGAEDAGGGHGGNALNRNVRQVGILGALGIPDGVNLGASEALAAVTNIDAVRSTRAGEANLKVGGLVGKLGGSRIEVPAVGLVNTKGSTQVVVSAGVSGGGTVAALERGTTGKKQVMAMVTADVRAPVQIQGGMSREEVKRVIDAHMDEITYCYETALIEEPSIMGKMAFEWRILESGRVGEVRIQSSSIRNETLHSCIRDRIRGWAFPKPRGAEVLVSYPFVFDVVGF